MIEGEEGSGQIKMSLQEQMKAKLKATGLPYKEIQCFGSQIIITAWSEDAARKWASLLSKFATVRGMVKTIDTNKVNENTCLLPTSHIVWRVGAFIS